jgi:hypothetical protein
VFTRSRRITFAEPVRLEIRLIREWSNVVLKIPIECVEEMGEKAFPNLELFGKTVFIRDLMECGRDEAETVSKVCAPERKVEWHES